MSPSRGEHQGHGGRAARLSPRTARLRAATPRITLAGTVVCVLHARSGARRLQLTAGAVRAVRRSQVHEVILTDDPHAGPGRRVDRVAYVAFFEVRDDDWVVRVGDRLRIAGRSIGSVAGFDLTHHPNHLNIVIAADGSARTGAELGVRVGDAVRMGGLRPAPR